jgi:LCP family protein required for cell wall assembly
VNSLESALHSLADDPLGEPAPSNLADRALARAGRRSRRHNTFSAVGAATVVALLVGGVATVSRQQERPTAPGPAAGSTASAPAFAKPRLNVLVIGTDAAPDRIGVRPDTIMLAGIDTRTGDTTLLSLPRSLQRVPFPAGSPGAKAWPKGFDCGTQCLLNSVWSWAEESKAYRGAAHPGLTATTQAVEEITGQSVDETVTVNMKGLTALVDAVGGVDVTVRERLPIGGDSNHRKATGGWIEPGRRHLNGDQALWFARSRWSTNDYDRISRQQCLITALADQVDAGTLLTRFPKIAKALGGNILLSIPSKELAPWAKLANRVQSGKITRISGVMPGGTADPDFAEIRRRVSEAVSNPAAATSGGPTKDAVSPEQEWVRDRPC